MVPGFRRAAACGFGPHPATHLGCVASLQAKYTLASSDFGAVPSNRHLKVISDSIASRKPQLASRGRCAGPGQRLLHSDGASTKRLERRFRQRLVTNHRQALSCRVNRQRLPLPQIVRRLTPSAYPARGTNSAAFVSLRVCRRNTPAGLWATRPNPLLRSSQSRNARAASG
jgi:hypothetical protein